MPPKAHLNASKREKTEKACFEPKKVIFPIFQFFDLCRGDPGIANLGGRNTPFFESTTPLPCAL